MSLLARDATSSLFVLFKKENTLISSCGWLRIGFWSSCRRHSRSLARFSASFTCLGMLILLSTPIRMFAQTGVQPGTFGVKLSGFENLVGGGGTFVRGEGGGGSTESEIEVTPQYKKASGTGVSDRGVLYLLAGHKFGGSSSALRFRV